MEIQEISGQYHVIESGVSLFESPGQKSAEDMLVWFVSGDAAETPCTEGPCAEN